MSQPDSNQTPHGNGRPKWFVPAAFAVAFTLSFILAESLGPIGAVIGLAIGAALGWAGAKWVFPTEAVDK
jgi:hypothetical protein